MNSNSSPAEGPGASHPQSTLNPPNLPRTGEKLTNRTPLTKITPAQATAGHFALKMEVALTENGRTVTDRGRETANPPKDTSDPTAQNPFGSTTDTFRESLFDALGDDEGAAYWESVYGQPIHNYRVPDVQRGPEGELEQMTEDEYVDYVRRRMWERTREGMLAEQERKEEAQRNAQAGREEFERAMEDSLRRGAERKRAKTEWGVPWAEYLKSWETIGKAAEGPAPRPLRNLIFWPVRSGRRADVRPQAVEEFMRHAPAPAELLGTLKAERIRWHPDKIQHRYGALGIDDAVMRSVTEVFQIVDRMWSEEREIQK
ncbi:hypothetical protein N7534_007662 [Penicillium rubens]|nr:hypothetical protein N7534_007662 [Penicillium rubens]